MQIQAKFESRCPKCGNPIQVGSWVEWKRGEKAVHRECPGIESFVARWRSEHPKGSIVVLGERDGWFFFRTSTSKGRTSLGAYNPVTDVRLFHSRRAEILAEMDRLREVAARHAGDRWHPAHGGLYTLSCELDKYVIFDGLEVDAE